MCPHRAGTCCSGLFPHFSRFPSEPPVFLSPSVFLYLSPFICIFIKHRGYHFHLYPMNIIHRNIFIKHSGYHFHLYSINVIHHNIFIKQSISFSPYNCLTLGWKSRSSFSSFDPVSLTYLRATISNLDASVLIIISLSSWKLSSSLSWRLNISIIHL